MIYVDLGGGRLGNQMFRYAYSRLLLSYNKEEEIVYNADLLNVLYGVKGSDYSCKLSLLNVGNINISHEVNYSLIQKVLHKIYYECSRKCKTLKGRYRLDMFFAPILSFWGLYMLNLGYYEFPKRKHWWVKNLIVDGNFECGRYVDDVRQELLQKLKPNQELKRESSILCEKIMNKESVAVCVRRGDFFTKQYSGLYGVCTVAYYENAIKEMQKRLKNPTFIFFSNDIGWTKENITLDTSEVLYESSSFEVWETLKLMTSCKHFIISNSTLHWWGQYLSNNNNKIVIAPSRWYNDKFNSALYQENMILIDP